MMSIMQDHMGLFALRGMYLAENKERIEREGKRCSNCTHLSVLYCDITDEECSENGVCKFWMNSSLSNLIEI